MAKKVARPARISVKKYEPLRSRRYGGELGPSHAVSTVSSRPMRRGTGSSETYMTGAIKQEPAANGTGGDLGVGLVNPVGVTHRGDCDDGVAEPAEALSRLAELEDRGWRSKMQGPMRVKNCSFVGRTFSGEQRIERRRRFPIGALRPGMADNDGVDGASNGNEWRETGTARDAMPF